MYRKLGIACMLVSGCSPLQQAPLMYTSKQTLGIDLTTPTAESPSLTFNLGFMNLDAVYIPLAVSKRPESTMHFGIEQIFATHGSGGTEAEVNAQPTPATDKVVINNTQKAAEVKAATEELQRATQEEAKTTAQVNALPSNLQEYSATVQSAGVNTARIKPIAERLLANLNALKVPSAIIQKVETGKPLTSVDKEASLSKAQEQQWLAAADTSVAQAHYGQVYADMQKDSMSVFSTFGTTFGHTTGDSGLSNRIGKVFSTGIAAQNLTRHLETSSLLEQCAKLLALAKNETQQGQVLTLCTAQSTKPAAVE